MTYYAVCFFNTMAFDDEEEERTSGLAWAQNKSVWTISKDPKEEGWKTDTGCDGYGLTYAEAKAIVYILNTAARVGWGPPVWPS